MTVAKVREKIIKRKSLTAVIFINTLLISTVVYFLCTSVFVNELYKYFEGRIFTELETEACMLKEAVKSSGTDFLKNINTENRITLIGQNGTVYFDNKLPPAALPSLENHNSRREIIEAKENGISRSSRYSDTMMEKTLYVAVVAGSSPEKTGIIRISCKQHSKRAILMEMSHMLILMLLIVVILSIFIATFISKKLCNSINKINLDNPQSSHVFRELLPFTKRISEENFEKAQRELLRQQFTANVSHELKTPLTSISGFAEILKETFKDICNKADKGSNWAQPNQLKKNKAFNSYAAISPKTLLDFSTSIYDESQRMITLVNDIIKLSKLDEQSVSQEKEELSLREITKEALDMLSHAAAKKHITINLTGDSGNITGVHAVIYEMIFNICDNAIKYNKEGGFIYIKINTTTKTAELGNSSNLGEKKVVSISVRDTGIGIPEKEQERIFERFYRIDKSRSKELGGTGLGLSIVKHGAKYHNAIVKVESCCKEDCGKAGNNCSENSSGNGADKNYGTTFTIIF